MARNHLPKNIHILKGTAKQHPERMRERENEPVNKAPIGRPSKYLNTVEKRFFKEIVKNSIDGVLGEADRIAVECAAQLLFKVRGLNIQDGEVVPASAGEQQLLIKYLGQFGMLPADRAKISIDPGKKKSAFDD
jgi:hypothetical protein